MDSADEGVSDFRSLPTIFHYSPFWPVSTSPKSLSLEKLNIDGGKYAMGGGGSLTARRCGGSIRRTSFCALSTVDEAESLSC
jgi:hypothetical protein